MAEQRGAGIQALRSLVRKEEERRKQQEERQQRLVAMERRQQRLVATQSCRLCQQPMPTDYSGQGPSSRVCPNKVRTPPLACFAPYQPVDVASCNILGFKIRPVLLQKHCGGKCFA